MSFVFPSPIFAPKLRKVHGLVHGFSTRVGGVSTAFIQGSSYESGDLNLGYSERDAADNVRTNRQRWLRALDLDENAFRYALLRQEHTSIIHVARNGSEAVDDFTRPGTLPGDGLLTDLPGVLLTVQTADCVPVLLVDPVRRVVGAFHAGWRGTLARIVEHGVRTMREQYGTSSQDVLAAIGPSIGPESYAVDDDVRRMFSAEFDNAGAMFEETGSVDEPQLRLNLWESNRLQLLRAGVPVANIDVIGLDTAKDTARFFSYRAERGRTGRMMSSIGLRA